MNAIIYTNLVLQIFMYPFNHDDMLLQGDIHAVIMGHGQHPAVDSAHADAHHHYAD